MSKKQLERVRRICSALPETSERLSHGEPTFFVNKKVFAMFANNHHNDGHIAVWLPAPSGVQAALMKTAPKVFFKPPYVGVRGWIGIELERISDADLRSHIQMAWKLIAPKRLLPNSKDSRESSRTKRKGGIIMTSISIDSARSFVDRIELPFVHRTRDAASSPETLALSFDTARNQAAVVGSEIISFVSGVTAERREAIVNSSLLAQLVAKKKFSDSSEIHKWYDTYFDVLTNIGWVIQEKAFAEHHEQGKNFEAHKAILAVATTLLGAAPTALALVKTTIDALHSMDAGSPWITIFNRESQVAKTARFQVSLAEQNPDGQFLVALMAFELIAKSKITQVLFFKAKSNQATLRHSSGRVTINTAVLDGVRDAIRTKLSGLAADYVKALPDLG